MADDIVNRLRHIHMEPDDLQVLAELAADEIERLTEWRKNALLALDKREDQIERLRAENQRLCAAVDDLLPVWEPCRYDHHDYCQAHYLHERPCPIETLRKVRDMSDKEINEVISDLRAALAIAAGIISTLPQYEGQHPQTVMEMLLEEARRG